MKNQLPYPTMVVTANPEFSTDVSQPQKSIFVTMQMDPPVVKLSKFDSQSPHSKMVPQRNADSIPSNVKPELVDPLQMINLFHHCFQERFANFLIDAGSQLNIMKQNGILEMPFLESRNAMLKFRNDEANSLQIGDKEFLLFSSSPDEFFSSLTYLLVPKPL